MSIFKTNRELSPNWTLAIFTVLNMLDYIDRSVVNSMLSPIKHEFNLQDGQLGDINAAFMFGYMIFSPLSGFLGDRMPRKYLIFLGVIVWSLSTWAGGLAPSILALMLARMMVSLGEASFGAVGPSVLSDKFIGPKRNKALTIFYACIPVGYAVGFIVGDIMHKTHGWRETLGWVGLPGVIAAFFLLPFKDPERGALDRAHPEFAGEEQDIGHGSMDLGDLKTFYKQKFFQVGLGLVALIAILLNLTSGAKYLADSVFGNYHFANPTCVVTGVFVVFFSIMVFFIKQMLPFFKMKSYMLVCFGYCAYTAGVGAYSVWGPQFMERVHGMQNPGTIFGLITLVGSLIGSISGGFLASAMRKKRNNAYALICGVSLLIGAPITAAAFLMPSTMTTLICMFLAVIFLFACTGPINTLILETVPVSYRCMAMAGSIFMIHILGDFWSPSIVGRVSDATGGNLRLALMLLPVFLSVGSGFWLRLAWKTRVPVAHAA